MLLDDTLLSLVRVRGTPYWIVSGDSILTHLVLPVSVGSRIRSGDEFCEVRQVTVAELKTELSASYCIKHSAVEMLLDSMLQ